MIVLALDTSTPGGSCAVVRDGTVVAERAGDPSRPQAARVPGDLVALVDDAALTLNEVDVFAVATGPGSFTGLRVGIAAMQALAFVGRKPLVGVSALDALAAIATREPGNADGSARPGRVATWVDAWRGEVYAALYEAGRELEAPSVEPPEVVLRRLHGRAALFIGDAVPLYVDRIRSALGADAVLAEPAAPPLAGVIAQMAAARAAGGECPPPDDIRPLYVRRTDAERGRDARAKR